MPKYRAVLLVPSVVEFENPGNEANVTEQVNRIAAGMGKAKSQHPRQTELLVHDTYTARVIECVRVDDDDTLEPPDLRTPPSAA